LSLTVSGNTISGGNYGAALTAFGPATINVSGNTISQTSQAGIGVASEGAGNINLFSNQNALSSTGVGFYLVKSGSSLTVNPATTLINNTVTGDTQWMTNIGSPTGSIILNGTTYILPTNAP